MQRGGLSESGCLDGGKYQGVAPFEAVLQFLVAGWLQLARKCRQRLLGLDDAALTYALSSHQIAFWPPAPPPQILRLDRQSECERGHGLRKPDPISS